MQKIVISDELQNVENIDVRNPKNYPKKNKLYV